MVRLQKGSGHKTRSIIDRYNLVNPEDKQQAMQKTQNYLGTSAAEELKHQPLEIRRVQTSTFRAQ